MKSLQKITLQREKVNLINTRPVTVSLCSKEFERKTYLCSPKSMAEDVLCVRLLGLNPHQTSLELLVLVYEARYESENKLSIHQPRADN